MFGRLVEGNLFLIVVVLVVLLVLVPFLYNAGCYFFTELNKLPWAPGVPTFCGDWTNALPYDLASLWRSLGFPSGQR